MKVLLVITNFNGFHEIPYAFGLSSIAGSALAKGHEVEVFAVREKDELPLFEDKVKSFKPQVIGFTTVSSQYGPVKTCATHAKKIDPSIIVAVGGVHATLYPADLLTGENVDVFFRGEAEIAFTDFLECIENNKPYTKVQNLVYKENGKIIQNQLYPLKQVLDELPYAIKDKYFKEYIDSKGYAPFFFARGCPYLCTYCSNEELGKTYGMKTNSPRYRTVDSCINEIKEAKAKYDFKSIWIEDDIFGLHRKWREEFCVKYKKEIGLPFICLLRPNVVKREFITYLKEAGCKRIMFGVESGNDYVANTIMKRNVKIDTIIRAFDLCHEFGIETTALNIIGAPGETEEMLKDTITLNRRLKPTDSGVSIFYPYRGTPLGNMCFKQDLVDLELYESFSMERRGSILKLPNEYREKLIWYQNNWDLLVYPYSAKKRTLHFLKKNPNLYKLARKAYRTVRRKNPENSLNINFTRSKEVPSTAEMS